MRLWHYTCLHGRNGIGRRGIIRPMAIFPVPGVSWLTSDPDVDADALGLARIFTHSCDRRRFLYEVWAPRAVRWLDSAERAALPAEELRILELVCDGVPRRPELWWVSREPVRGRLIRLTHPQMSMRACSPHDGAP